MTDDRHEELERIQLRLSASSGKRLSSGSHGEKTRAALDAQLGPRYQRKTPKPQDNTADPPVTPSPDGGDDDGDGDGYPPPDLGGGG